MKIFIIGYSGVGKSPFASLLCRRYPQAQHIKAGEWVRSQFSTNATAQEMAEFSAQKLKENINICVDFIREKYVFSQNSISIIEGIRNPYDFMQLFDPKKDMVIFVNRKNTFASSYFELQGTNTIYSYLSFLASTRIIQEQQMTGFFIEKENTKNKMYQEVRSRHFCGTAKSGSFPDLEDAVEHTAPLIDSLF